MKKILFNCVGAGPEKGGMYQYAVAFIDDYIRLEGQANEYIILCDDDSYGSFLEAKVYILHKNDVRETKWERFRRVARNFNMIPAAWYAPKYLEHEALSALREVEFDVSFALNQRVDNFYFNSKCQVSAIHDAPRAWSKPVRDAHGWSYIIQFDSECRFLIANSQIVLSDSDVSGELLRTNYQAKSVIKSLYFRPLEHGHENDALLGGVPLPKKFLFYPSTTHPVKNHVRLIDAISLANRFLGEPYHLILSGPNEWHTTRVMQYAETVDVEVRHLGYVTEEEKFKIMQASSALVMPSVFNFTNIPLFEAVFARCQVLCSDMPSSREIFGDRLHYFNPLCSEAIAAEIVKFDESDSSETLMANDRDKKDEILMRRREQLTDISALCHAKTRAS